MDDIMVDLETMDSGPQAAIVAIGAVAFDVESGRLGHALYLPVSLSTSVKYGGKMGADTVLWWLKQSKDASSEFTNEDECFHIEDALIEFESFINLVSDRDSVRIWGNGASFDNVILASAYKNAFLQVPWKFWNDRCYRTMKSLHPNIKMDRVGTHHNAMDDAKTQAKHLIRIFNETKSIGR